MVVFSFFLTVTLLAFFVTMVNLEVKHKVKNRIDSFIQGEDDAEAKEEKSHKFSARERINSLKNKIRDYYVSNMPSQKEEEQQKKLLQAGNPFNMTVADFYFINTIIRIAVPLLFGALALLQGMSIYKIILMMLLGFVLSFKALDAYVNLRKKKRYRRALIELPDFLDILTISVEAGLGFDIALNRTIEKGDGILNSEFYTCLEEMRLGRTRREALTGVKERLCFDEMTSFINSVLQSDKLGIGLVQTLRTKSEDAREKKKQRAEEEAMKTSIKILFPLIFLIFPSIFIIVFGPAFLEIIKTFSSVK